VFTFEGILIKNLQHSMLCCQWRCGRLDLAI